MNKKTKLIRTPKVKNKYNLKPSDIRKLIISDRSKLCEPTFWRNNVIDAWCISGSTAKTAADREYGTYNSYWIGIYDIDAKAYAGKIRYSLDGCGGMTTKCINSFYNPNDIKTEDDLLIQEMLLEKVNSLIDSGILSLERRDV